VLTLINPGNEQAVLSSFFSNFSNQGTLSAQSLASVAVSLNGQIAQRAVVATGTAHTSPVAAWASATKLIAEGPKPNDQNNEDSTSNPPPLTFPFARKKPLFAVSLNGFGQFQYQNQVTTKDALFPAYGLSSGGVILEVDYLGLEKALLGGAATYVYSKLNEADHLGSQTTQSVYGTAFAALLIDHLSIDLLISGSYNHNHVTRNFQELPGASITIPNVGTYQTRGIPGGAALGKYNSYQLVPHFDMNYEFGFRWFSLLPFLSSDCAITFERPFEEAGAGAIIASGCGTTTSLNTEIGSLTAFMLQNEAGLNFFEKWDLKENRGSFIFRQKLSYINRYFPAYIFKSKFLGTPAFQETSINFPTQNFFGSSAGIVYQGKSGYMVLTYEGMIGSGFVSNAVYLQVGRQF
jgi:hypothetical protein